MGEKMAQPYNVESEQLLEKCGFEWRELPWMTEDDNIMVVETRNRRVLAEMGMREVAFSLEQKPSEVETGVRIVIDIDRLDQKTAMYTIDVLFCYASVIGF